MYKNLRAYSVNLMNNINQQNALDPIKKKRLLVQNVKK